MKKGNAQVDSQEPAKKTAAVSSLGMLQAYHVSLLPMWAGSGI